MILRPVKDNYGSLKGSARYLAFQLHYYLLGCYRDYAKPPREIKRVIFVCKGNICRSPFAEVVFARFSGIPTCSIGLDTTSGEPADPSIMQIAANEHAFDLSKHRTTSIEDFRTKAHDIYICMEPSHIYLLNEKIPNLGTQNILLLGLFSTPPSVYIHDPYNASLRYKHKVINNIFLATQNLAKQLSAECQDT